MPEEKSFSLLANLFLCSPACSRGHYQSREDLCYMPTDNQDVTNRSKRLRGNDGSADPEKKDNHVSTDVGNINNNSKNDKSAWKRFRQTLGFKANKCDNDQVTEMNPELLKNSAGFLTKNSKGKSVIIIPEIIITAPDDDDSMMDDDDDTKTSGLYY